MSGDTNLVKSSIKKSILYDYKDLKYLTKGELFFWIVVDTTLEEFGSGDLLASVAIIAGLPLLQTRQKFAGATKGTSIASVMSRKLIRTRLKFRLHTITSSSFKTFKPKYTNHLGAFIGRAIPVLGWIFTLYNLEEIMRKSLLKYNAIVIEKDKLW
jgi:hypothetical protein